MEDRDVKHYDAFVYALGEMRDNPGRGAYRLRDAGYEALAAEYPDHPRADLPRASDHAPTFAGSYRAKVLVQNDLPVSPSSCVYIDARTEVDTVEADQNGPLHNAMFEAHFAEGREPLPDGWLMGLEYYPNRVLEFVREVVCPTAAV